MPLPPPKKKPKADLALLIPEEEEASDMPEEEGLDDLDSAFEDELPEEDALSEADPLADEASSIDPEQAALCETLGFTEPDQQQALLDLIKLVTAPPSDMGMEGDSMPPLPESTY